MKKVQPLYILLAVLALLLIAGATVIGVRFFPASLKDGPPVEPHIFGENGLFDLWFDSAEIIDISIDRNVTGILFASDTGKVSLLDRERRLRWEKSFSTQPLQAELSSCGNYLAVGTAGGKLFYMHTNQSAWWEKDPGEPVYQVVLSANGRWVAAGSGNMEEAQHRLKLYNHRGELQWQVDSSPLEKIYLVGEQPGQGRIYYSMMQGDTPVTCAVTLEGDPLWSAEGYSLMALSRNGNRLVAASDEELVVYNIYGEELWKTGLEIRVDGAEFNPQNGNLLIYGSGEGPAENFYCYNPGGELLWKQRIADGSLFAFTADGRQIITGSWRHYKDDYTQMVLYDNSGNELNRWEASMRVERLLVAGSRRYIVLADEDGYIDVLDMQTQLGEEEFTAVLPLYVPVVVGEPGDHSMVTLYFYDDMHAHVPITRSISPTEGRLRTAIEELISGPARASSLYRAIPKDARVETRFVEENGRLYLDLSPDLAQLAGSAQSIAALDSLLLTAGGFPEVKEIYLTVEGEKIEIFGDGLFIEQPLTPYRWEYPVYIPVHMGGGRYYLVPREARDMQIERRDLVYLLRESLSRCRNLYFIPGDIRLIDVEQTSSTVTINLNRSMGILFPEHGEDEEKLQAALLVDALMITAVANSEADRVIILVEGEKFEPPPGYPALDRTFNQPFYVNPEQ